MLTNSHFIALKYCKSTLRLPVEAWGMLRVDTERRSEVRRRTYQISHQETIRRSNRFLLTALGGLFERVGETASIFIDCWLVRSF